MNPLVPNNSINIERQKVIFPNFKSLRAKINVLNNKNIHLFFNHTSFADFIVKAKFLILSYQDVTAKGYRMLVSRIKVIFPITSEEILDLYEFKNSVTKKFHYVNKRKEALDLYDEIKLTADMGLFNPELKIKNLFKNANIETNPQSQWYCEEDIAYCLQLTLNILVLEFDLLKNVEKYIHEFNEIQIKDKVMNRGICWLPEKNIREAYLIPAEIVNDPFYKHLLSSTIIDVHHYDEGKMYVSWKFQKSSFNYTENKMHLNRLMSKNTNEELKLCFESIAASMDIKDIYKREKSKTTSFQFLNNFSVIAPILENTLGDDFICDATPALLEFNNYMVNHSLIELSNYKNKKSEDSVLFIVGNHFESIREHQAMFFYYIYDKLEKLIAENPKLALFLRDLSSKKGTPIRTYYDPAGTKFLESPKLPKKKVKKAKITRDDQKENIPFIKPVKITIQKIQKVENKVFCPLIDHQDELLLLNSPFAIKSVEKSAKAKVDEFPGNIFPYPYVKRVSRWDKHPVGEPLTFDGYTQLSNRKQMLQHIFHAPPFVGRFIDLGVVRDWPSQTGDHIDKCISVLSRIIFYNKIYSGAVNFTINTKKQECYHRDFSVTLTPDLQELFDEKLRLFNLNNISIKKKIKTFNSGSSILNIDNIGNIEIDVPDRNLKIELFNAHYSEK